MIALIAALIVLIVLIAVEVEFSVSRFFQHEPRNLMCAISVQHARHKLRERTRGTEKYNKSLGKVIEFKAALHILRENHCKSIPPGKGHKALTDVCHAAKDLYDKPNQ